MKRAKGHGFLLSLLLNMVFRGFWLVLVAVLVILHFVAGWPLWLIAIPLVAWFIHALLITLVLGFATSGPTTSRPEPKNVNPYSAKAVKLALGRKRIGELFILFVFPVQFPVLQHTR